MILNWWRLSNHSTLSLHPQQQDTSRNTQKAKNCLNLTTLSLISSLSSTYNSSAGWWGDGQARTLDQTFFHEQKKGGDIFFFLNSWVILSSIKDSLWKLELSTEPPTPPVFILRSPTSGRGCSSSLFQGSSLSYWAHFKAPYWGRVKVSPLIEPRAPRFKVPFLLFEPQSHSTKAFYSRLSWVDILFTCHKFLDALAVFTIAEYCIILQSVTESYWVL